MVLKSSVRAVGQWKRGTRFPAAETLHTIAVKFGESVSFLLEGAHQSDTDVSETALARSLAAWISGRVQSAGEAAPVPIEVGYDLDGGALLAVAEDAVRREREEWGHLVGGYVEMRVLNETAAQCAARDPSLAGLQAQVDLVFQRWSRSWNSRSLTGATVRIGTNRLTLIEVVLDEFPRAYISALAASPGTVSFMGRRLYYTTLADLITSHEDA